MPYLLAITRHRQSSSPRHRPGGSYSLFDVYIRLSLVCSTHDGVKNFSRQIFRLVFGVCLVSALREDRAGSGLLVAGLAGWLHDEADACSLARGTHTHTMYPAKALQQVQVRSPYSVSNRQYQGIK